jgi:hypothetical protein
MSDGAAPRAVVLPGARYTTAHPLLHFTSAVLRTAGWSIVEASWSAGDVDAPTAMVCSVAERLIDEAPSPRTVLVAKSLGTLAIPVAARRKIPGIWLTPLLDQPEVAGALDALPRSLLVGSTDDETWDGAIARASRHDVLELSGVDHRLESTRDVARSIDVLREVVIAVERFVDELGAC